jgi:hypothetical protein
MAASFSSAADRTMPTTQKIVYIEVIGLGATVAVKVIQRSAETFLSCPQLPVSAA